MKNLIEILLVIVLLSVLISCSDENDFPVPEASTIDASFSVSINADDPQTISFTNETRIADNAGNVSYIWNFDDGNTSKEVNPIHTYAQTGIYTVKLIVTADDDVDTYEGTVTAIGSLNVRLFYAGGSEGIIGELPGNSAIKSGIGTVYGVDYDAENDRLFYSESIDGRLYQTNLDGSEEEVLIDGLSAARDVAYNKDDNKVYIVDRLATEIHEYNLNTGVSKVLFSSTDGLGTKPIAIDYYDGFIYVTCVEIDAESVWKGDVNGDNINRIIDYSSGGFGYGLAIDKVNEKIYFDDSDTNSLLRSNLDGTSIEVITTTNGRVYGIVIDNINNLIYWSDTGDGLIKKAGLDGSDVIPVSVPLADPLSLFFIP